MPNMKEVMPILARSSGRWEGRYKHVTPQGDLVDTYEVRCHSEMPEDGSADYRLNTHNIWADGRETRASHEADWRDGRLYWKGALTGWMAQVDDMTLYLRFGFASDPEIEIFEMIQVAMDGQSRARTWHWFRNGELYQITLTDERRAD